MNNVCNRYKNLIYIITDMLERSVAEGLSVRVVPLKPGVITIDVRVRNMGQVNWNCLYFTKKRAYE